MKDEEGKMVILFHLKRFWEGQVGSAYIKNLDLYEEIRAGRKTSEFRDDTDYWRKRLGIWWQQQKGDVIEIGARVIGERAWFVCGYPKGNLPRLEATITEIIHLTDTGQFEIKFKDVQEAISIHVAFRTDDYHKWKKSVPTDT